MPERLGWEPEDDPKKVITQASAHAVETNPKETPEPYDIELKDQVPEILEPEVLELEISEREIPELEVPELEMPELEMSGPDDETLEPITLTPLEKPLVADAPVTGTIGEAEENYPEDWPDILPAAILPDPQLHNRSHQSRGSHHNSGANQHSGANHSLSDHHDDLDDGDFKDHTRYQINRRAEKKPIGGLLGMLIGLMVLAIYILLPLLATTSPLVTPAMAWEELINIGIISGLFAVGTFLCSILNSHRFSYALYAGVVFFGLSYGAHHYAPVRSFIDTEKFVLPLIAEPMREGYFRAAEYTGLPEKTGTIKLMPGDFQGGVPGDHKVSLMQRQSTFDQEVEGWLEQ
ncbi:hypothetical protein [Kiloniella sp.]|uniref:hypothetical protein n=1 Tax=Kiloniella sp. TaxID=1938587 RepID=UPI003B01828C